MIYVSSSSETPSADTFPLIPMTNYIVQTVNLWPIQNQLIKTYVDIKYHDQATSYVGMTITRSHDQSKIFISQQGFAQRIISDFLPDDFPSATSSASSHLINQVPDDKPANDRIKFLSIIMSIMYLACLSRPDLLLPTAYLATKAQHPKEGDHKAAIRIISTTINHGIKINCKQLKFHLHREALLGISS